MAILSAPAKVNLTLEILSRREDGYHFLRSLIVPIGLFDRITLEPATATSFTTNVPELENDNIVVRALRAAGITMPLRIELEKRIPVGGGLGGGSSDAASVLQAAISGQFGPLREQDWIAIARSLGSDVPFFLVGTGALVEGTGERLTAAGVLPAWWTLIVRPSVAVATAQAYHLLAASRAQSAPTRPRGTSPTLAALDALQRSDFPAIQRHLVNDFHDLILETHPVIARAHAAMTTAGAPQPLLSGSGSCLFALFADEQTVRDVEKKIVRDDAIAEVFVAPLVTSEQWRP